MTTARSTLGPLARYILDHGIHLEMAPSCHVQVGAVESFEQHPIAIFLRHGFNVGVNTDNRLMSDVMPSTELLAVATTFELSPARDRTARHQRVDERLRTARDPPSTGGRPRAALVRQQLTLPPLGNLTAC